MEQPKIQPLVSSGKNLYQLISDYRFTLWGTVFTVPRGFIFDGASIPRVFWTTTGSPFTPKFVLPGLVHDFFYRTHKVTRQTADKHFKDLLLAQGVGVYTRNKMYWAVRLFGRKAWSDQGRSMK